MSTENVSRSAAERITSAASAIQMIYSHAAPEKDGTEAVAWAIAALAESNLAIASAILESRGDSPS